MVRLGWLEWIFPDTSIHQNEFIKTEMPLE